MDGFTLHKPSPSLRGSPEGEICNGPVIKTTKMSLFSPFPSHALWTLQKVCMAFSLSESPPSPPWVSASQTPLGHQMKPEEI
ncbi:hypothetical protein EYF80_038021 [Liparis tanakae]|uniref:Uncharacterized protein n=1 Tax=Liparis tanakae TaxID=230148 RepID=A0A4Z2GFW9_9TELE|nr:hypothetical protein EYF80_038021 [Liparis tanakae]